MTDKLKSMDLLFGGPPKKIVVQKQTIKEKPKKEVTQQQVKKVNKGRVITPGFVFFVEKNGKYKCMFGKETYKIVSYLKRKKNINLINCWRVKDLSLALTVYRKKIKRLVYDSSSYRWYDIPQDMIVLLSNYTH